MLNVPKYKQENNLGCGPTSLSMVLKFFGSNLSEKELIVKVGGVIEKDKNEKWGTLTIDNALALHNLGYKVHLHSYSLTELVPSWSKLNKKEMKKWLKKMIKSEKDDLNIRIFKTFLEILNTGIVFKYKVPSLNVIDSFLDKKIPVILAVSGRILKDKDVGSNKAGHFIVVVGKKGQKYYYNDPTYGDKRTIDADKLIFALSVNTIISTGYLIAFEPNNN